MHRSRLSTVVIDCAEDAFEGGVAFWSRAFGREPLPEEGEDPRYVSLRGRAGGEGAPTVLLQRVPAAERAVHLDVETDDVEAEVSRLERLGARVKARIDRHVVMLAPTGHPFCVVPVFRGDFPAKAARWEEPESRS
ncbi:MAG: VOC family protein [Myxococcota bacterium]|nr:VOC family protein [Myxococcota bacterium]